MTTLNWTILANLAELDFLLIYRICFVQYRQAVHVWQH